MPQYVQTGVSYNIVSGGNVPSPSNLLQVDELIYKGLFFPPTSVIGNVGPGNGCITGRYVSGSLRLIITGTWDNNGGHDSIYEIDFPGVNNLTISLNTAPSSNLVHTWGD